MSFLQSLKDESDDETYYGTVNQSKSIIESLRAEAVKSMRPNEKLEFYGVEKVFHFKLELKRGETLTKFFCTICKEWISEYKKHDVLLHCSTLVHIFRYMHSKYPIEYNRIIDGFPIEQINERITTVKTFLNLIDSRLSYKREFKAYNNEKDKYYLPKEFEIIKEELKYLTEPMYIDFENKLKEKDERAEIVRHETMLANIKKDRLSPNGFLNSSLHESSDDAEMPEDLVENNRPSFNTNYNNDIKPNISKKEPESDIDTDSFDALEDEREIIRLIEKKALKGIKKKFISEKFLLLCTEYSQKINENIIQEIMIIVEQRLDS